MKLALCSPLILLLGARSNVNADRQYQDPNGRWVWEITTGGSSSQDRFVSLSDIEHGDIYYGRIIVRASYIKVYVNKPMQGPNAEFGIYVTGNRNVHIQGKYAPPTLYTPITSYRIGLYAANVRNLEISYLAATNNVHHGFMFENMVVGTNEWNPYFINCQANSNGIHGIQGIGATLLLNSYGESGYEFSYNSHSGIVLDAPTKCSVMNTHFIQNTYYGFAIVNATTDGLKQTSSCYAEHNNVGEGFLIVNSKTAEYVDCASYDHPCGCDYGMTGSIDVAYRNSAGRRCAY